MGKLSLPTNAVLVVLVRLAYRQTLCVVFGALSVPAADEGLK